MNKQYHLIRTFGKGGFNGFYPKIEKIEGMTPYEIWSCLFTDAMFDNLVEQTQLYITRDKRNHNFY